MTDAVSMVSGTILQTLPVRQLQTSVGMDSSMQIPKILKDSANSLDTTHTTRLLHLVVLILFAVRAFITTTQLLSNAKSQLLLSITVNIIPTPPLVSNA